MDLALKPLRISHLSLGVSDLAVSEKFYCDTLGLPGRREDDDLHVVFPDFLLVLSESPPAGRSKFHFGFKVADPKEVDAWADRVRSGGGTIVTGPAQRDGGRVVFFNDPDQYLLEIYSEA